MAYMNRTEPLRYEVTEGGDLLIEGRRCGCPYRVRDAVAVAGFVVVLYDPEANPRSWGTFPNLAAFDRDLRQVWLAETPETTTGDHYYRIHSTNPLVAYSWSGYQCEIDPASGQIVSRIFTK